MTGCFSVQDIHLYFCSQYLLLMDCSFIDALKMLISRNSFAELSLYAVVHSVKIQFIISLFSLSELIGTWLSVSGVPLGTAPKIWDI
jgi:hypothetical protein